MPPASPRRVVITGAAVLSPIGQDLASFGQSLRDGRGGVRVIQSLDVSALPVRIGGEVLGFDAKKIITGKEERKSLKMMARSVQMGVACAKLAFADSGIDRPQLDSTRFGVEFGSSLIPTELDDIAAAAALCATGEPGGVDMARWGAEGLREIQPLWMLRYLPNMVACHVSIFLDAQGPNNSITESEVAGLLALGEAARILRRDGADLFLVGAADSKINPLSLVRQVLFAALSRRNDAPERACRPFDKGRDGWVIAEGAGALAVEDLEHAERRGARIYAELAGFGSGYDRGRTGAGLARTIRTALAQAGVGPEAIDHVNAHGLSTPASDAWEARALAEVFGQGTPVFAPKSYFGSLSSAGSLVELTASLLALRHGTLPATLNYEEPDPDCPVAVAREPRPVQKPYVLKVSLTEYGQCAAAVLKKWEEA
jgi:3-oxoacyl-[acyl-carrier-protein] synthase II